MSDAPNIILGSALASGMKPEEAVARASRWWDEWGRHNVPRQVNRTQRPDEMRGGGRGQVLTISRHAPEDDLASGILRGLPWDELKRGEQLRIVKIWHHNFVVVPQEGAEPMGALKEPPKGGRTERK